MRSARRSAIRPSSSGASERIDMVNGIMRDARTSRSTRDFCEDITISLSASTEGIVDFVDTVSIPARTSRAEVIFTALAEGETTITATYTDLPGTPDEMTFTTTMDIRVQDTSIPTCTGSAATNVAPGGDDSPRRRSHRYRDPRRRRARRPVPRRSARHDDRLRRRPDPRGIRGARTGHHLRSHALRASTASCPSRFR